MSERKERKQHAWNHLCYAKMQSTVMYNRRNFNFKTFFLLTVVKEKIIHSYCLVAICNEYVLEINSSRTACNQEWFQSSIDIVAPFLTVNVWKSRKDVRRLPEFDPITFTFSENSNYWQENLLEVIRQNIAGWCQQTFEKKNKGCPAMFCPYTSSKLSRP